MFLFVWVMSFFNSLTIQISFSISVFIYVAFAGIALWRLIKQSRPRFAGKFIEIKKFVIFFLASKGCELLKCCTLLCISRSLNNYRFCHLQRENAKWITEYFSTSSYLRQPLFESHTLRGWCHILLPYFFALRNIILRNIFPLLLPTDDRSHCCPRELLQCIDARYAIQHQHLHVGALSFWVISKHLSLLFPWQI